MKFAAILSATALLLTGVLAHPQVGQEPPAGCKPVPLQYCHSKDIQEDRPRVNGEGDPHHDPVRPGLYCGVCPQIDGMGVVHHNGYYIDAAGRCCDFGVTEICMKDANSGQCPYGNIDK